jgi:hypothetical protein
MAPQRTGWPPAPAPPRYQRRQDARQGATVSLFGGNDDGLSAGRFLPPPVQRGRLAPTAFRE